MAAYLGATVLACIGYGSIFLAAGLLFRNPLIPAAVILVWESINSFLPSLLQKFSVIYYLKSLCPIQIIPESGELLRHAVHQYRPHAALDRRPRPVAGLSRGAGGRQLSGPPHGNQLRHRITVGQALPPANRPLPLFLLPNRDRKVRSCEKIGWLTKASAPH